MRNHTRFAFAVLLSVLPGRLAAQQLPPPSAADNERPPSAADNERPPSAAEAARADGIADEQPDGAAKNPYALNSWQGSSGGVHVIDASSGEVGSIRLQLGFDWFRAGNVFFSGDTDEQVSGLLTVSATPIEHLEIFGSLSSHANSNDKTDPQLLQVSGDVELGIKGYQQLAPWLSVGGDARLLFLDTVGDLGVLFKGTSVGFRGAATADFRHLDQTSVPLILRANVGYLFDNSAKLIDDVEKERYDSLPVATRRSYANEDRNLVNRVERFALGIDRVDLFTINFGIEAPLEVAKNFFIHPLLEWQLGIPVNRQGYSCLSVPTNASISGGDGCLAVTGLSAAPSTLTLGARVLPPVTGLSAMLAFDFGLLGTSTFVRELAPTRPWAMLITVGYAIDTRPPKPEVHYLKEEIPAPPPPPMAAKTRVHGSVVERGFATPIVGAVVRYPDLDLSPQLTGSEGHFTSYPLDPGEIVFEVTHPDYETGRCSVHIPGPNEQAQVEPGRSALTPLPAADGGGTQPETFVEVHCELSARPKTGALVGAVTADGVPVAGVPVEISGTAARTLSTDAGGSFTVRDLPAGDYTARVDAPNYLLKSLPFTLGLGADTSLAIALTPRPKTAQVAMTANELKIGTQIMFKVNSAEIDERSTPLLNEIADALQRNRQAKHVQVQGHTDNRGDSARNLELSQQRAEAVVHWLVDAGVDASRLEAKGYGDSRPIVPNLTPDNRARNRRVQFIIKKAE
ncbi:MAG TPA: OmpA family protein [Polyangiales bacterium]